jgi:hypothetical protein
LSKSSPFDHYVKRFGLILTGAATASAPLWSVFPDAPPLVPYGRPTVAAACAVLLVVVFMRPRVGRTCRERTTRLRWAVLWLGAALVLLSVYNMLLNELTVLEPQTYKTRFQVGFGRAEWSLTDVGRAMVREHPLWTPEQLMLGAGAFQSNTGAMLVWQPWSVRIAGLVLVGVYFPLFVSWIMAVAIAAREVSPLTVSARKGRSSPSSSDAAVTPAAPIRAEQRAAPRTASPSSSASARKKP